MYMRESWTDERLDDFSKHVDHRFDEVDRRFDRVEVDLREFRAETKAAFTEVGTRFERVESRIDDLHRTMLQLGVGGIATLAIGFLGLILTHA